MFKDIVLSATRQPLMYPLMFCSILSLAIIMERFISLKRLSISPVKMMNKIAELLKDNRVLDIISFCENLNKPLGRVIKAGILKHDKESTEIKKAMEEEAMLELPKFEKYLSVLGNMVYIAPLLGFLGTICGLIDIFWNIKANNYSWTPIDIASGAEYALITTGAGLIIAIFAMLAHNYFISKIQTFIYQVKICSIEIFKMMEKVRNKI
jgi:biopolymer transport protein ExbB